VARNPLRTVASLPGCVRRRRDAQDRYQKNPRDPLFLFDGSGDGQGHGVTRDSINSALIFDRFLFDVIDHQNLPRPLHLLQLEAKLLFESFGQRNRVDGFGGVG
jgi:hypothetical protein